MYKAHHNMIIKRYEFPVKVQKVISFKTNKRGLAEFEREEKIIKIAYFSVSPEELNETNGFLEGDLRVFCRNNQENILGENDIFKHIDGTDYIIKSVMASPYTDYKVFKGRRVIDSE